MPPATRNASPGPTAAREADAVVKPSLRRPLDGLPSIKWKLGAVIVAAVCVTVVVVDFGVRAGVSPILSGLAAGSLSLLMVQALTRGMTSPLREMAAATRAMAQGDYGRRVT